MASAVRVGDKCSGTCNMGYIDCPHSYSGGTCDTGSSDVFFDGRAAHRSEDTGATNCPHIGSFSSLGGSSKVFINGKPAIRVGDSIRCSKCGNSGVHTTGSQSVFIGG